MHSSLRRIGLYRPGGCKKKLDFFRDNPVYIDTTGVNQNNIKEYLKIE